MLATLNKFEFIYQYRGTAEKFHVQPINTYRATKC